MATRFRKGDKVIITLEKYNEVFYSPPEAYHNRFGNGIGRIKKIDEFEGRKFALLTNDKQGGGVYLDRLKKIKE